MWSKIEDIEILIQTTTPTPTPTTSTTPTEPVSPFDPDILNFVILVVVGGFMIILIMVIVGYVRQRSQRWFQF